MKCLALKIFTWIQRFAVAVGIAGLLCLGWAVVLDAVKGLIRSIKRHTFKK